MTTAIRTQRAVGYLLYPPSNKPVSGTPHSKLKNPAIETTASNIESQKPVFLPTWSADAVIIEKNTGAC